MKQNMGDLPALAEAEPVVSALSGFDPARVGGVTASNYDAQYEASLMLPRLDAAQREFIMRAKPHKRDQRLSAADWNAVECCTELSDWPPYRLWFGGMRAVSGAGQKGWKRTFRFNDAGLILRAAIAMAPDRAGCGDIPVPKDCQARAESIAHTQSGESHE
jgi:hypothetical protein